MSSSSVVDPKKKESLISLNFSINDLPNNGQKLSSGSHRLEDLPERSILQFIIGIAWISSFEFLEQNASRASFDHIMLDLVLDAPSHENISFFHDSILLDVEFYDSARIDESDLNGDIILGFLPGRDFQFRKMIDSPVGFLSPSLQSPPLKSTEVHFLDFRFGGSFSGDE